MKRFIILAALLTTPVFAQQAPPITDRALSVAVEMKPLLDTATDRVFNLSVALAERNGEVAALKKERDKTVADLKAVTKERDELKLALEKRLESEPK